MSQLTLLEQISDSYAGVGTNGFTVAAAETLHSNSNS